MKKRFILNALIFLVNFLSCTNIKLNENQHIKIENFEESESSSDWQTEGLYSQVFKISPFSENRFFLCDCDINVKEEDLFFTIDFYSDLDSELYVKLIAECEKINDEFKIEKFILESESQNLDWGESLEKEFILKIKNPCQYKIKSLWIKFDSLKNRGFIYVDNLCLIL